MTDSKSYYERKKIRALVVDDNERSARLLSDCISYLPRVVVIGTLFDGQQALEEALILRPDLVVTDLDMPGLNGMKLAQLLKRGLPGVRIVITSIHGGRETEAAVRACGAHYISKGEFAEAISGFIDVEFGG